MDYRNILAVGFVILCATIFVRTLNSANALPQGPNISLATNPYKSFSGNFSVNQSPKTLLTVPTGQVFYNNNMFDSR